MRRIVTAAILSIATVLGALTPAFAQRPPNNGLPVEVRGGPTVTPLGWYALGSVGCAAVAPMIGTAVLGREMTANEVGRSTLTCFLGPVGWWLGNVYFPDAPGANPPPRDTRPARGRNISIPPPGETHFVPNEILVEFDAGTGAAYLAEFARSLQLTLLETQTFALTGRTLQRWRIDGTRSVPNTLRALPRFARISAAQANFTPLVQQGRPAATRAAAADAAAAQYVVSKLHLLEAHRISNGDDVLVAVITEDPIPPRQVAPQLPLEAAIAEAGGFPGVDAASVAELLYWRLSGGEPAGEEKPAAKDAKEVAELAKQALAGLARLIARFDDPRTPYRSHPLPERAPRYSDYTHLARVKEWLLGAGTEF